MRLDGKTILVTGASSGIGKACVRKALEIGAAHVVLTGRTESKLEKVYEELSKDFPRSSFSGYCLDLNHKNSVNLFVKGLPKIDGFINSAGIAAHCPIRSLHLNFEQTLNTNFVSVANLCQELVRANKLNNEASLVFIASLSSVLGTIGLGAYASSKAAVVSFSKVLALELSKKKIRSNCVSPGMVRTDIAKAVEEHVSKEAVEKDEANYPLGYCEVEDVTGMVVFLLSDYSKKITGQNILIDGGYTIK